ncbi:MAG: fimbrillin family protein [Dysgonamonadaceae bacterium]|jgi:hypothetical protein|nr:fimbrillin family protein [Dysgonamonadaceae bacterium]
MNKIKHISMQKIGKFLLHPIFCMLFALASCDKEANENKDYGKPVPMKVEVGGVIEPGTVTRAQKPQVVETVTVSEDDFFAYSCSLERVPTTRATDVTNVLPTGTTYRVIAYRGTSSADVTAANYAGHKDYAVGSEASSGDWYFPEGNYYFVCYSYSETTAISDGFTSSSTSLTGTKIAPTTDLLYKGVAQTLARGANTLTINFEHTLTQVSIILDSSSLLGDKIYSATAKIGPTYSDGSLSLATGMVGPAAAPTPQDSTTIVWESTEFDSDEAVANTVKVFMNGSTTAKLTFAPAAITAGQDLANAMPNGKWQNINFGHAMQQGYRYVMRVKMLVPKLKVVVLATNNAYGYAISNTSMKAGSVLASADNFGPDGIVSCGGFEFVATSEWPTDAGVTKWITGVGNNGRIADLVYIAFYHGFNTTNVGTFMTYLKEYMEKGGAVVLFPNAAEGDIIAGAMATQILVPEGFTGAAVGGATPAGSTHPLPGNPLYYNSGDPDAQAAAAMAALANDPILNGPFGDVRDKQWGNDADNDVGISNLSNGNGLTVYSRSGNISPSTPTYNNNYVNGFRYETEDYNWVFFGDGGFMSMDIAYANEYMMNTFTTICPFNFDTSTKLPLGRTNWGDSTKKYTVYNSTLFCNIMAWAIKKSYYYKKKRYDATHP